MKVIDNFLNGITMYRLVLYELIVITGTAIIFGFFKLIPQTPFSIITSVFYLIIISWVTNKIFSRVLKVPSNTESVYITALILALIITPFRFMDDFIILGSAAVWGTASKYLLVIGKKHLFNPAAIAVVMTSLVFSQPASWWIGTTLMAPLILTGGILIVRKIQREDMLYSFFVSSFLTMSFFTLLRGGDFFSSVLRFFAQPPLLFFAFIMLTEPLTAPSMKRSRMIFGAIVGFLFVPQVHLGSIYSTPELALILGNIFSYVVSSKRKLFLQLDRKIQIAPDLVDFLFTPQKKLIYLPGQYMEWTLSHKNIDSRGNRRYFTLASSPTEDTLRLGVKFYDNGSSYKRALSNLDTNTRIVASQLAGDFTLPKDRNKKMVFIAGGVGITPFRSIIKYLTDLDEKRKITLFYANKTAGEIMYSDVFREAQKKIGVKTIYTLTNEQDIPAGWRGERGRITKIMILKEIPDYDERLFYLSGPHALVLSFQNALKELGINKKNIKVDYFPGFA